MAAISFKAVRATRTWEGVIREGWIVQRTNGSAISHGSILFSTKEEAEFEAERLKEFESKSPAPRYWYPRSKRRK